MTKAESALSTIPAIRLPGPVQVDKMKVERHAHDLRIILPKASA